MGIKALGINRLNIPISVTSAGKINFRVLYHIERMRGRKLTDLNKTDMHLCVGRSDGCCVRPQRQILIQKARVEEPQYET